MKITIEGASEEFEQKLLGLVAEHRHELAVTADTEWTVERAERYLRSLPAGARSFAILVLGSDNGYCDSRVLREEVGKLNGPTVALSRAIPRGVREGWWPEGTRPPISPVYDPDNPSWQKTIGYEMDNANVPIFRKAVSRIADSIDAARAAGLLRWEPNSSAMKNYISDPNSIDLEGGSRPGHDDQDEEGQQS
ncbi:hypothetical protein [Streptomyces sp. CA-146814]|uniref:hypothetical protein n=1 Tax=Streptomyces sp. CA-146814 TaxID=3240053 RepID=UPI003D91CC7A